MALDYKKYLPKNMRTGRWGEFIEAFQSFITTAKTEKIEIINRKYNIDEASTQELKDVAYMLGFNLSVYDGYTSTSHYLKKEIKSIVPRITNKNTRKGYSYIFNNFNLIGEVFPTLNTDELTPFEIDYDYETTVPSSWEGVKYLDPTTPAFLDTEEFPILDLYSFGYSYTRHLILNYRFKFIESVGEFMSEETCLALYNDAMQMKRKTEFLYFQPHLVLNWSGSTGVIAIEVKSYDETLTDEILIRKITVHTPNLFTKIKIGNGSRTSVEIAAITYSSELVNETFNYTISSDMQVISQTTSQLDACINITDKLKFISSGDYISEIGFYNSVDSLVYYAVIPKIRWDEKMLTGFRITFNII